MPLQSSNLLTRLARERYETIKTRDLTWDIYLAIMRGVVKNILKNAAISGQLSAFSQNQISKRS